MEEKKNQLQKMRHSCAHLLAAAVMSLYPNAKPTIGPAIENGFYYDFDFGNEKISESDLEKIEQEMRRIHSTWKGFERIEITPEEAKKRFKDNPYKIEIIEDLTQNNDPITLYKSGDFIDLCKGGHVEDSKELNHFKLLSIAGAYWRGNEKNPMLTRIYGTAFPTQQELDQHLEMLEEAKKRDHRRLGKELDLFVFSELVGKGLPLFTPKGTLLRELLNEFSQSLRLKRGYQKIWVPHITKDELYKVSGHWDKFGDELFLVKSQETSDQLVMKPMNCPHHQQLYASRPRSYKDLPIKYLETTTIYRDEKAGELLGLSRVRAVTQDDSHTFCTPEQIVDIYQLLIEITKEFYDTLGMTYKARLSFKDPNQPEKYLGESDLWDQAQEILLQVAQKNQLDYYVAEGEAAFYGPKIDFMVQDSLGREWQLATPQLDFVQPKRFGLTYVDADGSLKTPVMIHFALLGSIERFLSVYIEHTAGEFPLWLSPVQVSILPIADRHEAYAAKLHKVLEEAGIRAELDNRSERLQAKIREATLQKVPYMGIIGDKEAQESQDGELFISVRKRNGEDLGQQKVSSFIKKVKEEIGKKVS